MNAGRNEGNPVPKEKKQVCNTHGKKKREVHVHESGNTVTRSQRNLHAISFQLGWIQ